MKTLLDLLRRPLLHVAGLSFFVNLLLLVPALFMLQVFDRVLSSQSGDTLLMLLIGVGEESSLTLDRLRFAGTIAARESVRLGMAHVSFAPTLRDQGSSRIDVGEGDAAVAESFLLAYDTELRLQEQGLGSGAKISEFVIEAGPQYFAGAAEKVGAAVQSARNWSFCRSFSSSARFASFSSWRSCSSRSVVNSSNTRSPISQRSDSESSSSRRASTSCPLNSERMSSSVSISGCSIVQ